MSLAYEEILEGRRVLRAPPGARHETVCERLYEALLPGLADLPRFRLLLPRSAVEFSPETILRPDITLVEADSGVAWLIVEVVEPMDHQTDTVFKKSLYQDIRIPRLWMIDPRYSSVELYRATAFGITLTDSLGLNQSLAEKELPGLKLPLRDLFADPVQP